MPREFDSRLAPYAEQLTAIIGGHAALQQEYEANRRIFNAHFRKVLATEIRPTMDEVMAEYTRRGYWVEIHSLIDRRYLAHVHQCYSINGTQAGKVDIAAVANYDYKKIFFILEMGEKTHQQQLTMTEVNRKAILDWLLPLLPTL
ncbi:hypothetical protein [Dinghuibacter silviterrae]|uniref:Uncharacterized protein n=1 Tax=Dinghuibacter silviterrae TaxID=1539049 RepID=A0A4R8DTZ8_9BACT|nr:hypothetical protein [Dinghuibacter silviterrae]TDX01814.1 hypothetical protein EDB95_2857 [Dinghuibacter silviterrae]